MDALLPGGSGIPRASGLPGLPASSAPRLFELRAAGFPGSLVSTLPGSRTLALPVSQVPGFGLPGSRLPGGAPGLPTGFGIPRLLGSRALEFQAPRLRAPELPGLLGFGIPWLLGSRRGSWTSGLPSFLGFRVPWLPGSWVTRTPGLLRAPSPGDWGPKQPGSRTSGSWVSRLPGLSSFQAPWAPGLSAPRLPGL